MAKKQFDGIDLEKLENLKADPVGVFLSHPASVEAEKQQEKTQGAAAEPKKEKAPSPSQAKTRSGIRGAKPKPLEKEVSVRYRPDPGMLEVRSRRLQLVLQPSLYVRIRQAAESAGISINDYCHGVLDRETPKD